MRPAQDWLAMGDQEGDAAVTLGLSTAAVHVRKPTTAWIQSLTLEQLSEALAEVFSISIASTTSPPG